tara:strand:- start:73 stop:336 length:264 start_codon:yes stop_codon:yes gene_type:complete
MADMFWKIQVDPVSHRYLYMNVNGKMDSVVPATVPAILARLNKYAPKDRIISGYFFNDNSELAEDVNEILRQKVRTAIRKFNRANEI